MYMFHYYGKCFIEGVFSALYPRKCPICRRIIPWRASGYIPAHPDCLKRLQIIKEPMCQKCGKPLRDPKERVCYDCRRVSRSYERGRSLWRYDDISSEALFAFKYGRKKEYALFFGRMTVLYLGSWIRSVAPDAIVPVPVSPKRLKERGFNQAEETALVIGAELGIPVLSNALYRTSETRSQKSLGRIRRGENLAHAFAPDQKVLKGVKCVLLFDDIYTTGSTAGYCARALKSGGAERVYVVTLCIGGAF